MFTCHKCGNSARSTFLVKDTNGRPVGHWCLNCLNPCEIVAAEIGPMPQALTDPMPEVKATLDAGVVVVLFDYYPDEISFTPNEFVGLTYEEGRRLKFKKDRAYLQSPGPSGNARPLHGKAAMAQAVQHLKRTGRLPDATNL